MEVLDPQPKFQRSPNYRGSERRRERILEDRIIEKWMKINLFNFLHITPVFSIVRHKENESLEMMKVESVNTQDECKSLERLQIPCKKLKDAED